MLNICIIQNDYQMRGIAIMNLTKRTLLLGLITLACVLPTIAVYESKPLEQTSLVQTGNYSKRIYSLAELNLTCHSHAPSQVTIDGNIITISPMTTEIAFDIDDVILQKNISGMIWETTKQLPSAAPIFTRVAYESIKYPFTKKKGKGLELISDLRDLSRGGNAGGAYAQRLNKYKPGLGRVVNNVAVQKTIISGMYKVVLALHNQGYILRPATNQSVEEYEQNKQRLPDMFGLFKDGMAVDYAVRNRPVIKKPDQKFFEEFNTRYDIKTPSNPHGKHIVIFVDDKEENVKAAAQAGLIAIHFVTPKKLIKDFYALGLPIPSGMNEF